MGMNMSNVQAWFCYPCPHNIAHPQNLQNLLWHTMKQWRIPVQTPYILIFF